MRAIDLRSDTVTKPTPAMRQAMFEAEVGDDVFGEDPTVNALEAKAAEMLGHEAALFTPSGTMSNQIAIKVLTKPGDEVIMAADAHPFMFESGAPAVISAVQVRTLPSRRGQISAEQVESVIRPKNVHHPPSRLVCLENTSNRGGGSVYPLEAILAVTATARRHQLSLHLDGARIFNACAASGLAPSDYARHFDTVSFCLSKGLGAPVGSILVGGREVIAEARRWRKLLGGGMRQAGILAAAGLYALEHHVRRLAEDHENAKILAQGLARLKGLEFDPTEVETNIIIFRVVKPGLSAPALADRLKARSVLVLPTGPEYIRVVTHLDVNRDDIHPALKVFAEVISD
ncbi:MAG: low-specificity L-threonine aldolase [Thermodesulfobacteriota bacterium]